MAAQLPDIIMLNGVQMKLYSNPLEQYWMLSNKERPAFRPSENCTRGYIATWELRDKALVLLDIQGHVQKRHFFFWKKMVRYTLKILFKKAGRGGVLANWVTGKIRIPQGKQTLYVHRAYDSRFEREMVITLEQGKAVKTVVLDYTQQKLRVEE